MSERLFPALRRLSGLAVTLFGERLDAQRLVSFGLIWAGLAVYVATTMLDRGRRERA